MKRFSVLRRSLPSHRRSFPAILMTILLLGLVTVSYPARAYPVAAARAGASSPTQTAGDPSVVGSWTAPFTVDLSAIHLALLHTGQVLMFSDPDSSNGRRGSEAKLWTPAGELTDVSLEADRDLFCAGHSFLPDGRLFTTGGHEIGTERESEEGIADTFFYSSTTKSWTSGPLMSFERWYPTNVELADGTTLIFAGMKDESNRVLEVESYDHRTNDITTLPATANKALPPYPRMILLPSGKVFFAGPYKETQMFDPATNSWSWVGSTVFGGVRNNGNAVALPGLNKVMAIGGTNASTGTTATTEIIDFSAPKPAWRSAPSLNYARNHANAVLLADGTVGVFGGGKGDSYDISQAVRAPELFEPGNETGGWKVLASQAGARIYHSTALLLPDGRVLSAGMDYGPHRLTAEVFSPPYLFKGPRPSIVSADSNVSYGRPLQISTPEAADIARVALVRPGSVTHSFDMTQRYVDLAFTKAESDTLTATAPPDGNHAPPGWYMLFIVSASGVPSVASWVHVS